MTTLSVIKSKGLTSGILLIITLFLLFAVRTCQEFSSSTSSTTTNVVSPIPDQPDNSNIGISHLLLSQAPRHVRKMINYLKSIRHFTPPKGYKGGKVFRNREGKLPRDKKYREYDVHPTIQNQSRGKERLVIDEQKSVFYYTKDHYNTFVKIVPK